MADRCADARLPPHPGSLSPALRPTSPVRSRCDMRFARTIALCLGSVKVATLSSAGSLRSREPFDRYQCLHLFKLGITRYYGGSQLLRQRNGKAVGVRNGKLCLHMGGPQAKLVRSIADAQRQPTYLVQGLFSPRPATFSLHDIRHLTQIDGAHEEAAPTDVRIVEDRAHAVGACFIAQVGKQSKAVKNIGSRGRAGYQPRACSRLDLKRASVSEVPPLRMPLTPRVDPREESTRPMRHIGVPQAGHVPFVAGRPFFSVTC